MTLFFFFFFPGLFFLVSFLYPPFTQDFPSLIPCLLILECPHRRVSGFLEGHLEPDFPHSSFYKAASEPAGTCGDWGICIPCLSWRSSALVLSAPVSPGPCPPHPHPAPQDATLCFTACRSPVPQGGYLAAHQLDKAFVSFNGCTTPSPDMFYAPPGGFDLLVCIHK